MQYTLHIARSKYICFTTIILSICCYFYRANATDTETLADVHNDLDSDTRMVSLFMTGKVCYNGCDNLFAVI